MVVAWGDRANEEWIRLKKHVPKSGQHHGRWASHRRAINGDPLPAALRHRRWSADGAGTGSSRLSWLRRCRGPLRLVDGERGLHLLPRSPARRRSTSKSSAGTCYRCAHWQHRPDGGLGRSRGGLTAKIHLASKAGRRPLADHTRPVGMRPATDPRHGTHPCPPLRQWPSACPASNGPRWPPYRPPLDPAPAASPAWPAGPASSM